MIMENADEERKAVLTDISIRIRHFRHQQGLSMDVLAKRAGFTKSYLSQIENRKREPTIGTLVTIAHALGVSVFSIIGGEKAGEDEEAPAVVKASERRRVAIPLRAANIVYESINYKKQDRLMDAYILTPSTEFSDKPMAHEGQELLFVLEGEEELVHNGKSYLLEKGDCCHFDSSTPHYGRSIGEKPSKILVVFTMKPDH
jgi:transcriptional regulator with XRE-family HTH domain